MTFNFVLKLGLIEMLQDQFPLLQPTFLGMVQPFSRLYNGSWVFSAISENVQVTLQCPDGNIPTSLMGFGIVGLAEGCTISNEEFWYPHTFAGSMQLNLSFGDKGWESTEFHTGIKI